MGIVSANEDYGKEKTSLSGDSIIPALAYFPQDLHPSIISVVAFQDLVRMGKVGSTTLEKPILLNKLKNIFLSR